MAVITLRVLDGADRGRVFDSLQTPITIGREEGNAVQLNDERISRFHVKIQEDQGHLVLTDLESTNGTRVNGEQAHLRILRYGDLISLGRSVLLYGTREQIAGRLDELKSSGAVSSDMLDKSALARQAKSSSIDYEIDWNANDNLRSTLHLPNPPEIPQGLSPGQAAQLSEIIEYLHLRSRTLVDSVKIPEGETTFKVSVEQWQCILDLQSQLGEYLRKIGEPGRG
jgi:pSer/pThr/pTyr-binding forkhead associated (FHA) protein